MNGKIGTIRQSPRGPRFDALLKNENATGCKFYSTQCNHCEIPALGRITRPLENQKILEKCIGKLSPTQKNKVRQANIYATGNFLDREEYSDETFAFSIAFMRDSFPNADCIGVDARPEIALSKNGQDRIIRGIALAYPARFETISGYETQDEKIRRGKEGLNKQISESELERLFELAGKLGFGIQVNVMLMPVPTMSLKNAVEESLKTIKRVRELDDKYKPASASINLNPLYITKKMVAKWGEGILDAPLPSEKEIQEVVSKGSSLLPIFVGRDDEDLAIKKGY